MGTAPHRAAVRAINGFGAAVPSAPVDLTLNGQPLSVSFDGLGYGGILLEAAGSFSVGGAGAAAVVHALASDWPGAGLDEAWPAGLAAPHTLAAVTTGGLAVEGPEVWWFGDGLEPHRVVRMGAPVLGLRAGNIDVDGTTDAIVWTSETLILLKGRAGGGMAMAAGIEAPGLSIAGADIGDLSADNLPDLAIAWVDQAGVGTLDVLEGSGLFTFTPALSRRLPHRPVALAIGDNTGEGIGQITVLLETGDWARFIRGAPLEYMPIGPNFPVKTLILPPEAVLLQAGDLNGDGGAEVSLASPRFDGVGRNFWYVDIAVDTIACQTESAGDPQCGTLFLPLLNESGAYTAIADGNGDFIDDVFILPDSRNLSALAYDAVEKANRRPTLLELPSHGPIGLADFDRDGSVDLLLAGGPMWWRWSGESFTSFDLYWEPRESAHLAIREALLPPFGFVELDGDAATLEVVAFAVDGAGTALRLLQHAVGSASRAIQLGQVTVDGAGRPIQDLAICGNDVYVVVDGAVKRIALTNPAAPAVAAIVDGTATAVACGAAPSNADIAVLDAGRVQLRTRAGLGAVGGVTSVPGAVSVAVGNGEMRTCATPECTIAYWPHGIGGVGTFATGDAEAIVVLGLPGGDMRLNGTGSVSIADVDGDGRPDLVSKEAGTGIIGLHRSTGAGIVPSRYFHPSFPFSGIGAADGDGDGHNDLWGIDPEGDLVHTVVSAVGNDAAL